MCLPEALLCCAGSSPRGLLAEDPSPVGAPMSRLPECLGRQARASKSWVLYSDEPPAVCEIGHKLLPWPHCRPIRSSSGIPILAEASQPEGPQPRLTPSSRTESSGRGPRRTGFFSSCAPTNPTLSVPPGL